MRFLLMGIALFLLAHSISSQPAEQVCQDLTYSYRPMAGDVGGNRCGDDNETAQCYDLCLQAFGGLWGFWWFSTKALVHRFLDKAARLALSAVDKIIKLLEEAESLSDAARDNLVLCVKCFGGAWNNSSGAWNNSSLNAVGQAIDAGDWDAAVQAAESAGDCPSECEKALVGAGLQALIPLEVKAIILLVQLVINLIKKDF